MGQATTDADGFYRFDNLKPGTYKVCADASSFAAGQPLAGQVSSTVTAASADGNVNSDDNGVDAPSPITSGVCTTVVTLGSGPGEEPTGDLGSGPGDGPHGDANSNLTVDLGFFKPFSVGNRVWRDLDNSGTVTPADGANPGVNGVTVALTDTAGNPVTNASGATVASTTTNAEGFYRFDNLTPGVYRVVIDKTSFLAGAPLAGTMSSTPTEANPDDDVDANDNGVNVAVPSAAGVRSADITLGPGSSEPLAAVETGLLGTLGAGPHGDSHANMTVDFGFFTPLSVGNRVWEDKNNSGTVDAPDGTAPGIAGVTVAITTPAGGAVSDPMGNPIGTVTTDATGLFRFDNVPPGDYKICVEAGNFGPLPAVLNGFSSSGTTEADPDGGSDANDNGIDTTTATTTGVCTGTLTLGPPDASEPLATTETGGGAQGPHGDAQADLTVDFGFVKGFSLGNQIFEDLDNDGTRGAGEPGVAGVSVRLTDAAGNPVTNVLGDPVVPTTTTVDGFYRFDLLKPGDYRVLVEATNFDATAPSPLEAMASSTPTEADPDADVDATDNGINTAAPAVTGVRSDTITLGSGEPTGETGTGPAPDAPHGPNGDSQSNLTLDFGFVRPFSVGNRVWEDADNSGAIDAPDGASPGLAGVTVALRTAAGSPVTDAFGAPVGPATTSALGFYRFDRLAPGTYVVCLDKSGFAAGGPVAGMTSSDPTSATANDDVNSDDNGIDDTAPATNGICSGPVTLAAPTAGSGEPLADLGSDPSVDPNGDDHSNHSVDFGLFTPFSVGNRVWLDVDNDGTVNAADGPSPGAAGVKVNLLTATGAPATDVNGVLVPQTTTDANGFFRFDGLPPGDFRDRGRQDQLHRRHGRAPEHRVLLDHQPGHRRRRQRQRQRRGISGRVRRQHRPDHAGPGR